VVTSLFVDDGGHIHICGEYAGEGFDPGGGALPFAGDTDMFLASYSADGSHLFSAGFGGAGKETCEGIAVDLAGNYYLTGHFSSEVLSIGGDVVPNNDEWSGPGWTEADGFAVKLSPEGLAVWSVRIGGYQYDRSLALALAPDDSLYVAGFHQSFLLHVGDQMLEAADGSNDMFIAAVDPTGEVDWAVGIAGSGNPHPTGLAIGPDGELLVAGWYYGTVLGFGDGPLPSMGTGQTTDIVVAAYGADGTPLWAHGYGGTGDDSGETLAVGPDGNVYLGANLGTAGVAFGPSLLAESQGGVLLKLTSAGEPVWLTDFYDFAGKYPQAISVDGTGIYVAPNHSIYNSVANLVRLTENGSRDWRLEFTGAGSDSIFGLGLDGNGSIFIGVTSSSQSLSLGGDTFSQAESFTTSFVALGAFSL